MKLLNVIAAFSLLFFISCGGGGDQQQQQGVDQQDQGVNQSQDQTMAGEDAATIEIIGLDNMQFAIEEESQNVTAGDPVGDGGLQRLETITAEPGEQVHIRLTTQSDLPASAMAHNWVLLDQNADVEQFASAAVQAKDNDYIPSDNEDQVIALTDLAAGGETVEVTFTVPEEPGEYEFICTFPGHYSAGMRGVLRVEDTGA